MKVIDLLNKIANGEEVPKKIKYANCIYYLDDEWIDVCYRREDNKRIFEEFFVFENLNEEVEIIEDTPKRIEKLNDQNLDPNCLNVSGIIFRNKINEIIDKINVEK